MWIKDKEKIINLRRLVVIFLLTDFLAIEKLTGTFKISWLWVFSPIWIPFLILIGLGIGIIIYDSFSKDSIFANMD